MRLPRPPDEPAAAVAHDPGDGAGRRALPGGRPRLDPTLARAPRLTGRLQGRGGLAGEPAPQVGPLALGAAGPVCTPGRSARRVAGQPAAGAGLRTTPGLQGPLRGAGPGPGVGG